MPRYCQAEQVRHGEHSVAVVTITRRDILEPQTIEQCRSEIEEVDPSQRIVLNMRDVDNVSTGFITVLVVLSRSVRENGGRVAVCQVRPRVEDVFKLLRIERIVSIVDSLDDALYDVCSEAGA